MSRGGREIITSIDRAVDRLTQAVHDLAGGATEHVDDAEARAYDRETKHEPAAVYP